MVNSSYKHFKFLIGIISIKKDDNLNKNFVINIFLIKMYRK